MLPNENTAPPKWPLKLLRFFLRKEYVEEIEGDMEEIFYDNVEALGRRRARRRYTWEVLALLRPILLRHLSFLSPIHQTVMLSNYFKTSIRSLSRNPLTSFINVFGLAVAIGICLVVYAFMEYDRSIDQYHANKNEIYLTTFFSNREGTQQQYGLTPRPLAEVMKQDFPQVKSITRVEDRAVVMKQGDQVFHEQVRYVDPSFLEMFTFPMKWGAAKPLHDASGMVLSEEMAEKYFGDENPVGREMLMIDADQQKKVFVVTGVAMEFPKARDIDFQFLANIQNLTTHPTYDESDWSQFVNATFVQVKDASALPLLSRGMEKYRRLQNGAQPEWPINSFAFEPLTTLHSKSANIRDGITHDYNVEGRIGMPIIALFMIALACFNYINIAIVSAARRLKEIGIRKVIGGNRLKVVVQFLTENVVITFFALLIGLMLAAFVFIPWFVQFSDWPLELNMVSTDLWMFLVVLLLFTGLVSGMYPAFYISRFDAVKIFKGNVQFGRKNPLTKIFLGVQLVLACITITAGVVFTQNNTYQNNRSWGYNHAQTLFAHVPDSIAFNRLRDVLAQNPHVISVAGSADHLGRSYTNAIVHLPDNEQYKAQQFSVDANYFQTMGLELLKGRGFTVDAANDRTSIIVNQLFVDEFGGDDVVGKHLIIDSARYEVIGVVKDFHTRSFFSKVEPAFFKLAGPSEFRYFAMQVEQGYERGLRDELQRQWAQLYPEIPFQGGQQREVWASYFHSVDRSERFNKVIATIAVLLASLGLYGLVTLNVTGRTKEFSIRKTLGAGADHITGVIMKQYALLALVALLFGAPMSYMFTKAYLDMLFAYPMPMDFSGVTLALLLLVLILVLVISTQVRKVLKLNPVLGLKDE